MKVLVSDAIAEEGVKFLKEEGLEVDVKTDLKPDELIKIIGAYDGLIVRSKTKVTADVMNAAKNLKVILRAGSGIDNVDVAKANELNIVVMNVPGGNTVSAAEHAIAMLFSLSRQIPQADASMKAGKWEKKKFEGVEISGKTLGIIGLGRIGREVVKRAKGLGMRVFGYDPVVSPEQAREIGCEPKQVEEIIKNADFITFHTPMTKDTKHMLGEKEFAMMKPDVRIINCARGGLIDEKALYNALKSGKIAGAALDVFETEPPVDNPLLKLENVIFTPHLGASTKEGQIRVSVDGAKQVSEFLISGMVHNAVNVPPVKIQRGA